MNGLENLASVLVDVGDALTAPATVGILVWLLSGAFLISGSIKLMHPVLAAQAMVNLGLTHRLRKRAGIAVGVFEVALGLLLALRVGLLGVALLVTGLLCLFAATLSRAVNRGASFPCFCFGDHTRRVSLATVARTLLLASASGVVVFGAARHQLALGTLETEVLQAIAGAATIGAAALAATLRDLLQWNRALLGEGDLT